MRENGIFVERKRKFKATTNSDHRFNIAPNLLERDFTADQPNQKWAGDISYIWTREGWLYLAVILDLHSRRVIGWAVSDRLTCPRRNGACAWRGEYREQVFRLVPAWVGQRFSGSSSLSLG